METRYMKLFKLILSLTLGIVVILVALRLVGFELVSYPPDRPAGIPVDTEWAGGRDGGVWIKCTEVPESHPQQFRCDIYGENGSTWLSDGLFQPFKVIWDRNSNSPIYGETRLDKLDYNGWDGRSIHLLDGYILELLSSRGQVAPQL